MKQNNYDHDWGTVIKSWSTLRSSFSAPSLHKAEDASSSTEAWCDQLIVIYLLL